MAAEKKVSLDNQRSHRFPWSLMCPVVVADDDDSHVSDAYDGDDCHHPLVRVQWLNNVFVVVVVVVTMVFFIIFRLPLPF